MTTRKRSLAARLSAALLALVMAVTLAPAARAVSGCPENNNGEHNVPKWETFVAATCHTKGVERGVCTWCEQTVYMEVDEDPRSHDAVYTDEGNGYHTGVCSYHTTPVSIPAELHAFVNGVCSKCGVMDYSNVKMNLPADLVIPVALNSADAKLSVGELKLTLGSANVTDGYTLSYTWYYQGSPVASTEEYILPVSITGREGIYYYTLFVSATPKSSLRQPVSSSCNVTVQVEDLITASAAVSSEESLLYLGDQDTWSGESVSSQIYAAVQDACPYGEYPDYVVFQTLPSSTVGTLVNVNTGTHATSYYFDEVRNQKCLDDVEFRVATGSNATTGDYTVGFTAYDTGGNSYPGVLTITVQQSVGDMDVVATTSKNGYVTLSAEDFEAFWNRIYPNGALDYITFKDLPWSTEGSLSVDYISASAPGLHVKTKDRFYVAPGNGQYGIDDVTFVPGVKQTEYITLDFEAQGIKNNGNAGRMSGTLYLFIHSGGSADVDVTAASAGVALPAESFQKAYQSATGGTGTSFCIRLLEIPAQGALYVGRTASRPGTLVTAKTVGNYSLNYSDVRGETISSVTYVPAAGTASESIRYVACSAQGKPLYTGRITFTTPAATVTPPAAPVTPPAATGLVLDLTATTAGVKLSAGSFENLPGAAAPKLTRVSFTPVSAAYGAFYYGRTATTPGTEITTGNAYFSAVTVNPPVGSLSLDNLTFVPADGMVGTTISVAFTATDASNNRYTGTLRVTVTGAATAPATPDTPTTPSTPATPDTPAVTVKKFSDVPETAGSYPYITALTTSGALKGYPDGTFKPGNTVTMGEALKLIMCVANPTEYNDEKLPALSGGHWASGYLERAIQDGLLPANVNKNMDRTASRYTIAEIAAKALGLAPVENAASTPFADMPLTNSSAKYVLALYNAEIIRGSTNKSGQVVYYGVNAIIREEFATIVWRIQSYRQNGYVGAIDLSAIGADATDSTAGDVG